MGRPSLKDLNVTRVCNGGGDMNYQPRRFGRRIGEEMGNFVKRLVKNQYRKEGKFEQLLGGVCWRKKGAFRDVRGQG